MNKFRIAEIWYYDRGRYKGYSEDLDVAKRIMNWNSVVPCSIYYTPSMRIFAYDFIFPSRTYNRVAKVLGLPLRKKPPASVKRGRRHQRLLESDCIGHAKSSNLQAVEV